MPEKRKAVMTRLTLKIWKKLMREVKARKSNASLEICRIVKNQLEKENEQI